MCGIVAYIGGRTAYNILIKGLQRLEYRGYDSAGIALMNSNLHIYKCKGRVKDLEDQATGNPISGTMGMGHTRWATHGIPNNINAHPHLSMNGKFAIVHNGIIENYAHLKKELVARGYTFKSETDTEVLANLIENIYLENEVEAEMAVRLALTKVAGAYGIIALCTNEPDRLIVARNGSPMVIGIGDHEYFVASDTNPIIEYTDRMILLNDEEVAVITRDEIQLKNLYNDTRTPNIIKVEPGIEKFDKAGYNHFMLKEIHEQPSSIADTFRGRISLDRSKIFLGGIADVMPQLASARRLIIIACGTSWHSALVGEYLFEEFARIPVEVEYASEFRYRNPIINKGDVVIAISQSGETADTLAAVKLAKEQDALIIGICNVPGTSIPRETQAGVYTHAGPEIGAASTKAFTSQVTVLAMMALMTGKKRNVLNDDEYYQVIDELIKTPERIKEILSNEEQIIDIAQKFKDSAHALYLGRGNLFPVALEGALKLKEISRIHAEGYPAAEIKHGPIALIDENMPVFVLATKDKSYEKIINNIQEVKARNAKVIAIVSKGDDIISRIADYTIEVPNCHDALEPLLTVVPLQLISYHIAVLKGYDVDRPGKS
jgi:glucosamine--fructose-6-phosphate aminotransferase (isomerizing)